MAGLTMTLLRCFFFSSLWVEKIVLTRPVSLSFGNLLKKFLIQNVFQKHRISQYVNSRFFSRRNLEKIIASGWYSLQRAGSYQQPGSLPSQRRVLSGQFYLEPIRQHNNNEEYDIHQQGV